MLNALLDGSLVLVVEEFCQVPSPFNVVSIQHHALGLISREDMVHGHDEAPHLDDDAWQDCSCFHPDEVTSLISRDCA